MALINCPECNHGVSDTADTCPNCGYNLTAHREKPHTKKSSPLSKTRKKGYAGAVLNVIGSFILIGVGIPLISLGVGIVLIILGVIGFFTALNNAKKYQYGDCPYCGTELRVVVGNASFKCPICNNVGVQTTSTLETTHNVSNEENTTH